MDKSLYQIGRSSLQWINQSPQQLKVDYSEDGPSQGIFEAWIHLMITGILLVTIPKIRKTQRKQSHQQHKENWQTVVR